MHVFSLLDNRTLMACDFILAIAFSAVFFAMKRSYPVLRGINTIAISFLLGIPGLFLLAAWGVPPHLFATTLGSCFTFASFIFLYRGILRFIGSRRTAVLPIAGSVIGLFVLYYFSHVQQNIAGRIFAISITIAFVRGLIAIELLRKSPSFNSPKTMRLFAAITAFLAAMNVQSGIASILRIGSPESVNGVSIATTLLFTALITICLTGLLLLMLSGGEMISQSRDLSLKDSLSGAFNRRGIEAKLQAELKHVQRGRARLSVALIDVDHFKAINDVQGHAAGDAALRDVADAISSHLRGRDFLGRYGGDEFLLILPNTPAAIALAVTERLCKAVTNLNLAAGTAPLTLSIGISEAVSHDDAASLLARADKALYQAKSDGRNCRRMFNHNDHVEETQTLRTPVLVSATNSTFLHR